MTCKTRTPIFSDDNVSTYMMEQTSADDAAECVDTQIGSNTGDWIGYQATGLNRIDAIIMGLLTISVLASFAGCVLIATRSDTIWDLLQRMRAEQVRTGENQLLDDRLRVAAIELNSDWALHTMGAVPPVTRRHDGMRRAGVHRRG